MDIKEASTELYKRLQIYEEVIGMSTTTIDNVQFIVIYLTNDSTHISKKIPTVYQGYSVKKVISGSFYFQLNF